MHVTVSRGPSRRTSVAVLTLLVATLPVAALARTTRLRPVSHGAAEHRTDDDLAERKARHLAEEARAEKAAPRAPGVAPSNDTCAGAEVVPAAGPFPYLTAVVPDITDATVFGDPPHPSCQSDASRSLWYAFTPSASGGYTFSVCADAPTATTVDDTVLAVYSTTGGCGGTLTEVGCDDDACVSERFQSTVTATLSAGTSYFVVVWKFGAPAPIVGSTAVQLRVSRVTVPANDTCATAVALALAAPVSGALNDTAANDYQLSGSGCFTGVAQTPSTASGRDVVYTFTAPTTDDYSFKLTYAGAGDPVLYVASSCPSGTGPQTVTSCLGAANRTGVGGDAPKGEEVPCLAMTAGQLVYVYVDEDAPSAGGTFAIEVDRCSDETEANDTPATADALSCGAEGAISPATDVDFYALGAPPAGSRVFAVLDGLAGSDAADADFDLRVTTATDTLQFDDGNNDDLFGPADPNIEGTPLTGAAAYLRVNVFQATAASEPYRLYAVVQPPIASATPEAEPNDTLATATSAASDYFSGALTGPSPSADTDLYRTHATAGDLLVVGLDCDPTRNVTPVNPALALLDAAGNVLVSVNDGTGTASATPGTGTLESSTPLSPGEALTYRVRTSGTYYVRVQIGTASTNAIGAGDYLLSISRNCQIGGGGAGAGSDTVGVYAPTGNAWFLRNANSSGNADVVFNYGGSSTLVALKGDWDGNGTDTPGLYNPATGTFFLKNSDAGGPADITFSFGAANGGFTPISGDWDNNGTDTIGLYNPATGVFFLRNSNSNGNADLTFTFGGAGVGYMPIAGDWNDDGTDSIGLYNPATGVFFLKNANANGNADFTFQFGAAGAGYLAVAGDWNGDGTDTVGLYLPTSGAFFLTNTSPGSSADYTFVYGPPGLKPLAGDWDGL